MEPDQEAVRYYLVYATNHPRGVEVFKAAENRAAKIQDKSPPGISYEKNWWTIWTFRPKAGHQNHA